MIGEGQGGGQQVQYISLPPHMLVLEAALLAGPSGQPHGWHAVGGHLAHQAGLEEDLPRPVGKGGQTRDLTYFFADLQLEWPAGWWGGGWWGSGTATVPP